MSDRAVFERIQIPGVVYNISNVKRSVYEIRARAKPKAVAFETLADIRGSRRTTIPARL